MVGGAIVLVTTGEEVAGWVCSLFDVILFCPHEELANRTQDNKKKYTKNLLPLICFKILDLSFLNRRPWRKLLYAIPKLLDQLGGVAARFADLPELVLFVGQLGALDIELAGVEELAVQQGVE